MNEHREEVPVMLMRRREPVCRTGALHVVGKVHADRGLALTLVFAVVSRDRRIAQSKRGCRPGPLPKGVVGVLVLAWNQSIEAMNRIPLRNRSNTSKQWLPAQIPLFTLRPISSGFTTTIDK